jgi:HlyD family type I secretion membrane fusion protein
MSAEPTPKTWSARLPIFVGAIAIVLLVGGIGAWSLVTEIAGAVVASGTIKVESNRQIAQHPDGGVVGSIEARDGDVVRSGDILVRFDDTFLKSELAVIDQQLMEIYARKVRLEGEREGSEELVFARNDEFAQLDQIWVQGQIDGQVNLFRARLDSLAKEQAQLAEQRQQVESQIVGIEFQRNAVIRQFDLIALELADQQALREKGLVPVARMLELQREEARLDGDIGRLVAEIAEAKGKISGILIEILKLSDRRREEAITRLRDLRYSEIELIERQISLHERLDRMVVCAPVDGIIYGSSIFALKSVVRPADPMIYVVPGDQPMQVLARIDPIHIDQVYPGQAAWLRFSTFDQRTTPEIEVEVVRLSADTVVDEATGAVFYEAVLVPVDGALDDLPELILRPGMPVEAFLKTRQRTPLSYLVQPLANYFNRAFREE